MLRNCLRVCALCFLWLASVCVAGPSAPAAPASAVPWPDRVRIGVLAFRPVDVTYAQWAPTADYLARQVAGPDFSIVPLTLDTLGNAVASHQVDFVLVNPEQYVVLAGRHQLAAVATLVRTIDGRPVDHFGGVIFTRADLNDVRELADLRGRRIAAASDASFAGFLIQRWTLQQAGIDIVREAGAIHYTGLPQDAVVQHVLAGKSDAGFVRTGVLEQMAAEGRLAMPAIRVLNPQPASVFPQALSTALYPEWPLAVQPQLPADLVKAVVLALYRMAPQHAAAQAGNYYGFVPPGDYASLEKLLLRLRLHPDYSNDFGLVDIGRKYAPWVIAAGAIALQVVFAALLFIAWQNRRLKQALARAERLALRDDLLNSLSEGVYGVDLDGRCTFINPAALAMLGFERDELIGQDQHLRFHHHYADGRPYPAVECPAGRTLRDGKPRESEELFFRKDGSAFPVRMAAQAIWDSGRITGAVVAFEDITARREAEAKIRALALHDALTGLPNRRLLGDRIELALAQSARDGSRAGLLFLDLDGFKPINDRFGHEAGDAVLVDISRRLEASVRSVDTVARFAGDEFVVLLPGVARPEDVETVADKIVALIAEPVKVGSRQHAVTVSVGLALYPTHGPSADDLLRAADDAMYCAKAAGKNGWRWAPEQAAADGTDPASGAG